MRIRLQHATAAATAAAAIPVATSTSTFAVAALTDVELLDSHVRHTLLSTQQCGCMRH